MSAELCPSCYALEGIPPEPVSEKLQAKLPGPSTVEIVNPSIARETSSRLSANLQVDLSAQMHPGPGSPHGQTAQEKSVPLASRNGREALEPISPSTVSENVNSISSFEAAPKEDSIGRTVRNPAHQLAEYEAAPKPVVGNLPKVVDSESTRDITQSRLPEDTKELVDFGPVAKTPKISAAEAQVVKVPADIGPLQVLAENTKIVIKEPNPQQLIQSQAETTDLQKDVLHSVQPTPTAVASAFPPLDTSELPEDAPNQVVTADRKSLNKSVSHEAPSTESQLVLKTTSTEPLSTNQHVKNPQLHTSPTLENENSKLTTTEPVEFELELTQEQQTPLPSLTDNKSIVTSPPTEQRILELPKDTKPTLDTALVDSSIDQIQQQIEHSILKKETGAVRLVLYPDELGSIQILVKSASEGLEARLETAHSALAAALNENKSDLVKGLADQGITISHVVVAHESGSFHAEQGSSGQQHLPRHKQQLPLHHRAADPSHPMLMYSSTGVDILI